MKELLIKWKTYSVKMNHKIIIQIMYYKIKTSGEYNGKQQIKTFLTDGENFAEAASKVINIIGTEPEIEDIALMKNFKPAINEQYESSNKLYMIKIAEDQINEKGLLKTIKYVLPAFANNSDELHKIVNDYIAQGLNGMRLTTISETKWIYI